MEKKNIVIIEDHPFVIETLNSIIEVSGHRVVNVVTKFQHLDSISKDQREKVDLVMLGFGCAKNIGLDSISDFLETTPSELCLMSALEVYGMEEVFELLAEVSIKVDHVLKKPFRYDAVVKILDINEE